MPLSLVILQGRGPLPLKGSFDFRSTLPANIVVSGTAYAHAAGGIGVNLAIDGTSLAGAQVFANEANSHKALVSDLAEANLEFGTHQAVLDITGPNTVTDANDFFTVTLIY